MRRTITIFTTALLLGCPASDDDDAGDDGEAMSDSDGTAGSADAGGTCTPGAQVACACTDGTQGTQTCDAEGSAFDACECGGGTSAATTGTGSATDDGGSTTSPTGDDSTGADTTPADTGMDMCTPGVPEPCDCPDGPGFQRCNEMGELGECSCCEGSHPLVEGDLRYCEEGSCYCGALQVDPPIDVCYEAMIAESCCPGDIDLVCY